MISNNNVTLNSSMGLTPFPGQDLTACRADNTFGQYKHRDPRKALWATWVRTPLMGRPYR